MAKAKQKQTTRNALTVAIEQAVDNTPLEMVPLSALEHTELNVRKKKPDAEKLQELANNIFSVGLIHNLIVFELPNGKLGVAAGGRRLSSLGLLLEAGRVNEDYAVPVKKVPKDMAVAISLTENAQREEMHPADQIVAFGQLSEMGNSAADIGGILGYSTKHVQRCMRLAGMAPELLTALAAGELDLDQLQALSATEDHERQLSVWQNASFGYQLRPEHLRTEVLRGEVAAEGNTLLEFIGRDVYEEAGGSFRYDLFTDQGFISDAVMLETLARQKLESIAEGIALDEGWKWSEGRLSSVSRHGADTEKYLLLNIPEPKMSEDEAAEIEVLEKRMAALSEIENEDADQDDLDIEFKKCKEAVDYIKATANIRAWDEDTRSKSGVVASLGRDGVTIRRGIMLHVDLPKEDKVQDEQLEAQAGKDDIENNDEALKPSKGLSAVLTKSLSSERTLAVQASLASNPEKALVIFVHDCLKATFDYHSFKSSTLKVTLNQKTNVLFDNAPTAKDSLAAQHLNTIHETWQSQLPDNWENDWGWLLSWDTTQLISIMGYCLALTLDGSVDSLSYKDNKAGKDLEPVESLLGFTLRDWWIPTKANFFGRISKEQISECLLDANLKGASSDSLKMKKGDAAELAEAKIILTSWVPDCLSRESEFIQLTEDTLTPESVNISEVAEETCERLEVTENIAA